MITGRYEGRRCIVVGSAPNLHIPLVDEGDVLFGVNGGAAEIVMAGYPLDVLVTTSHLFRHGPVRLPPDMPDGEVATLNSLGATLDGYIIPDVWVDAKNGPATLVADTLRFMRASWVDMFEVPDKDRFDIIESVIGERLWVSSGVWAVCLALAGGASSVLIAGISLDSGHTGQGTSTPAPRHHVMEDTRALHALFDTGLVGTNSPALLKSLGRAGGRVR